MSARGLLAYVMGPSGAGKDTLLAGARAVLDPSVWVFAHRYITRPPMPEDENFMSLSPAEFDARREAGLFAFHWRAREVDYGIGAEIETWRARGLAVVVSGSRADWRTGAPACAGAVPVLITAPPELLAARLATRGRDPDIERRLARADEFAIDAPDTIRIDNAGTVAEGVAAFVATLNALRTRNVAAA
ncbi:MAG: phosphonate metabolism protein/1,5-bisphosphokinase (PRPP-forming) PhnN [Tagaea sp.]